MLSILVLAAAGFSPTSCITTNTCNTALRACGPGNGPVAYESSQCSFGRDAVCKVSDTGVIECDFDAIAKFCNGLKGKIHAVNYNNDPTEISIFGYCSASSQRQDKDPTFCCYNDLTVHPADQITIHAPPEGATEMGFNFFGRNLTAQPDATLEAIAVGSDQIDNIVGSNSVLRMYTEVLLGNDGGDEISGLAGEDYIEGGDAIDVLYGGPGNDTIIGGGGGDVIYGDGGHDHLDGGDDNDSVFGGRGNDIIIGGPGGDPHLNGESGHDRIHGGPGHDTIDGGSGTDWLYGSYGSDKLVGGWGSDVLCEVSESIGNILIGDQSNTHQIQPNTDIAYVPSVVPIVQAGRKDVEVVFGTWNSFFVLWPGGTVHASGKPWQCDVVEDLDIY